MQRDPAIQAMINAAEAASAVATSPGTPAGRAAADAFHRVGRAAGVPGGTAPHWLPACDYLDAALDLAGGGPRQPLADAIRALAPRLAWEHRRGGADDDRRFLDGHANAMLIGPRGLETRDDVWFGLSLMAPAIDYPEHSHPPEEVYLSLTPGEWWNERMDWTDPGSDGAIYNPPGIRHRMRSGMKPFLALWILPV